MLTCDGLYEQLIHAHPVERQYFERDLALITSELCALFGRKYVLPEEDASGELPTREQYYPALLSGILFLERREEEDRLSFLERGKSAFLTVWKEKAKKGKGESEQ